MTMRSGWIGTLAVGAIVVAGCASEPGGRGDDPTPPVGADEGVSELQTVTVGAWTATGLKPLNVGDPYWPEVMGGASFTGPSGQTNKMGLCLLKVTGTSCTGGTQAQIDAQCHTASGVTSSPDAYGQFNYCFAPNGTGSKKCAYRPGNQAHLCAGSPALGGAAIGPGTYWTPTVTASGVFISYACFAGCSASDPSASGPTFLIQKFCGGIGQPPCP